MFNTTILYETVGTFCNKLSSPIPKINVVKDNALQMNKRHVYTNTVWWGRKEEDACLEHGYWIIHVILYTYILIMNVVMISRACVPTSFVQDCSLNFYQIADFENLQISFLSGISQANNTLWLVPCSVKVQVIIVVLCKNRSNVMHYYTKLFIWLGESFKMLHLEKKKTELDNYFHQRYKKAKQ